MSFSPQTCPHPNCLQHTVSGGFFIRKGFFRIQRNHQKVRRFQCKSCQKTFSSRTFSNTYRQFKPHINKEVLRLHCEGLPQRGMARILGVSRRTIERKFLWLAAQLGPFAKTKTWKDFQELSFDEMETIEHTKLKPLSIVLCVSENYEILKAQVAVMPAKGALARLSRDKYGPRIDQREEVLKEALSDLHGQIQPQKIISDAKPSYWKWVQKFFPGVEHEQHNRAEKERHRERLHEKDQKKKFDPMFVINQRCAKLRADIRRLTRRSWCTTKKPENLQRHLDLYVLVNNLGVDGAWDLIA